MGVTVGSDPERPQWILVSVSDTGRGIEPTQVDHVFDRLHQVRSGDAAIEGGLGLGLYICREVVTLHGGGIWVNSTLGKGSTFFFTVPKCVPAIH
ncbi:MAG: sensor histidine kinase [Gammaproteobacteria bacterium]